MKIIFDIGANKGQNFNYFFEKADVVIAFEANPNLVEKIKSNFKQFINDKKLVIENIAITNEENLKKIDFYISNKSDLQSSLYPNIVHKGDIRKFYKEEVRCEKASSLIKKYLKEYSNSEIEYIKIDIEGADKFVLDDLLKNNIVAKNLSVECHEPDIIKLLINSPYKSFKFLEGGDMTKKGKIEINNKNNVKKIMNFDLHTSGPYGEDIPGNYYNKNSIITYFLNTGLGWKDVHCAIDQKDNLENISYMPQIHLPGFRYHLKNILPSFIKALKFRIIEFFKRSTRKKN